MTAARGNPAMRAESKRYFAALGAHITQLRKAHQYTQAELARRVGVSQQAMFAYEIGDRRISVPVVIKLATIFDVSLEELLGLSKPTRARHRRISPRIVRRAAQLEGLSRAQQRFVIRIIDYLEQINRAHT